jgi:hypothetical protein
MLQKPLFAAANFIALPVWKRQWRILLGNAVPQVFDELETFSQSEFEKRREFGIHTFTNTDFSGVVQ